LSVDVAKLESGQELFEEQKITLTELRLELAEQKTETVRISTENKSLEKDVTRLEADNAEYKGRANDFYAMQSQLVEAQKLIAQLKVELSDSEKEREVLTKQTNVK
jgi:chromosome segregation ATPase